MSTDPKEKDEIKDEDLEPISGGTTHVQPVQVPEPPDSSDALHARFPEPR